MIDAAGPEPDLSLRKMPLQDGDQPRSVSNVPDVDGLPRRTQENARAPAILGGRIDAAQRRRSPGRRGLQKAPAIHDFLFQVVLNRSSLKPLVARTILQARRHTTSR